MDEEKKRKKLYKEFRERDIKIFSKIYGVKKKDVKKAIKALNEFSKRKRTVGKVLTFLEGHGFDKKTAYKLTGMLQGNSDYLIDTITNYFHYKPNDPELHKKVKDRNYKLFLGENELERRESRKAHRNGTGLYNYSNEKCEWKDISEIPDHNDWGSVIGEILVTVIEDEDEPLPNHHTHYVGYLSGWKHPEIEFIKPHRPSELLPKEYVDKFVKWMSLPSYRAWDRG